MDLKPAGTNRCCIDRMLAPFVEGSEAILSDMNSGLQNVLWL